MSGTERVAPPPAKPCKPSGPRGLQAFRAIPDRPDLDIFVIKNFAQDVLKIDPTEFFAQMLREMPMRGIDSTGMPKKPKYDHIAFAEPQWVDGLHKALHMRRSKHLPRDKFWAQRFSLSRGYLTYRYPGFQWRVAAAQFHCSKVPALEETFGRMDKWTGDLGLPRPNHLIGTRYVDGNDFISEHSDLAENIAKQSYIFNVKMGPGSRRFVFYEGEKKIYDELLPPGTAVIFSLEANQKTTLTVPKEPTMQELSGSGVPNHQDDHWLGKTQQVVRRTRPPGQC